MRFGPYVVILGEGYVVVYQSEYVGLKRKILVKMRAGDGENGRPGKPMSDP
jgi:hypothetical protein